MVDRDSPGHEEGTGLDPIKSSPMYGGSISWNASEMWISTSSEDVVEVCEASDEQEVKESVQPEDTVIRRLALSARKPRLEGD